MSDKSRQGGPAERPALRKTISVVVMKPALPALASLFLAFAGPVSAQGADPDSREPRENLERMFTPPHPACRTWTNGCVSCTRETGQGLPICQDISIPGACAGRSIVCTQEQTDEPRKPE